MACAAGADVAVQLKALVEHVKDRQPGQRLKGLRVTVVEVPCTPVRFQISILHPSPVA